LYIIEGLLAGNVFDWGASTVAQMMQDGRLDFSTARHQLQRECTCAPHTLAFRAARPWLADDYDAWYTRLSTHTYACACIFVDNSGHDIICGVLPLVLDLLARGTSVILCANANAVLNDVTYAELCVLIASIAKVNEDCARALADGRLMLADSGQT
jgi:type II pantothenate kinase